MCAVTAHAHVQKTSVLEAGPWSASQPSCPPCYSAHGQQGALAERRWLEAAARLPRVILLASRLLLEQTLETDVHIGLGPGLTDLNNHSQQNCPAGRHCPRFYSVGTGTRTVTDLARLPAPVRRQLQPYRLALSGGRVSCHVPLSDPRASQ